MNGTPAAWRTRQVLSPASTSAPWPPQRTSPVSGRSGNDEPPMRSSSSSLPSSQSPSWLPSTRSSLALPLTRSVPPSPNIRSFSSLPTMKSPPETKSSPAPVFSVSSNVILRKTPPVTGSTFHALEFAGSATRVDDGVVAGHHVLLAVALHLGLPVVGRVVGAGRTRERVDRGRAADQVVLAVTVVVGVLVEAEHLVLAAVALHRVVGRAAAHDVVTGATPGVVVAPGRPGVVRRSRSRPR